jgi:peptidoglycan/xylan/chitin deacetylase (PgdA/CDA1 family)
MAATLPRRLFLVRGPARSNSVCLTFDDGPHPEHTPRVLDVLKEQGVTATFFVIGERAERNGEVVRRIVDEGHALGHHSFTHSDPARTAARTLLDEVRKTRTTLAALAGVSPPLFRPPHGKLTTAKLWGLWRDGQTVVLWNVDPKDFSCRTEGELRAWFQARPLRGGDIVLMHDNHPHAAGVLAEVIGTARGAGLTFTTPLEWVRRPAGRTDGEDQ